MLKASIPDFLFSKEIFFPKIKYSKKPFAVYAGTTARAELNFWS